MGIVTATQDGAPFHFIYGCLIIIMSCRVLLNRYGPRLRVPVVPTSVICPIDWTIKGKHSTRARPATIISLKECSQATISAPTCHQVNGLLGDCGQLNSHSATTTTGLVYQRSYIAWWLCLYCVYSSESIYLTLLDKSLRNQARNDNCFHICNISSFTTARGLDMIETIETLSNRYFTTHIPTRSLSTSSKNK